MPSRAIHPVHIRNHSNIISNRTKPRHRSSSSAAGPFDEHAPNEVGSGDVSRAQRRQLQRAVHRTGLSKQRKQQSVEQTLTEPAGTNSATSTTRLIPHKTKRLPHQIHMLPQSKSAHVHEREVASSTSGSRSSNRGQRGAPPAHGERAVGQQARQRRVRPLCCLIAAGACAHAKTQTIQRSGLDFERTASKIDRILAPRGCQCEYRCGRAGREACEWPPFAPATPNTEHRQQQAN